MLESWKAPGNENMRHEREMWELAKALAVKKGIVESPNGDVAGYALTSSELSRLYRRYGFTNLDVIARHTEGWTMARMAYKCGDMVFFHLSDSIWDSPALMAVNQYAKAHPKTECVKIWGDLYD